MFCSHFNLGLMRTEPNNYEGSEINVYRSKYLNSDTIEF